MNSKALYYKKQLKEAVNFIYENNKLYNGDKEEIKENILKMIENLNNSDSLFISSFGVTVLKLREDDDINLFDILVDLAVGKKLKDPVEI